MLETMTVHPVVIVVVQIMYSLIVGTTPMTIGTQYTCFFVLYVAMVYTVV